MTTGFIITGIGIMGIVLTLLLQAVLFPVFRKQQKKLLEELEK